jgi:hypothetical protein
MKRLILILLSRFPRKLPAGMTEFEAFIERIVTQTGLIADIDSMKFALSSILIHADSKHGALPDKYFTDRLIKSAANQVASQIFQDVKQKQAEAAKQPAEATASPTVTSDANKETKA